MNSDMWRQRRVLVTGCTGVLGSWLVLRLLELGADVVGLVRDWVPSSQLVLSGAVNRIVTVRGDVTDPR
ncbi:putative sugar dehydratase/epimerase YfnG [Anaerolineaceae bacterium]|nr:putative sugar dehydratase/epimerase YfnG [Anaerolineaceae bacterium]